MNLAVVAALDLTDVDAPIDVPLCPPSEWLFQKPGDPDAPEWIRDFDPRDGLIQIALDGPDEGRYVALVAPEGEQILRDDINWQPPQSPTGYDFAHAGTTLCADGSKVRTANIGGNINHAPPSYAMRAAVDLYANTATRTLRGRYYDVPGVGVVSVGAMWPGLTKRDAITAMGMAISGDWRHVASLGARDMAGSQLVNAPALRPLPHGAQRRPEYRPMRFLPVAAGLGTLDDVVFGAWDASDTDDGPSVIGLPSVAQSAPVAPTAARPMSDLEARLAKIEHAVSTLIVDEINDEPLDPDNAALTDLFHDIFGCKACHGRHGDCPVCHGTGMDRYDPANDVGYDMADELDGVDPEPDDDGDDHEGMGW